MSWEQLLSIHRENAQMMQQDAEQAKHPIACPHCGGQLVENDKDVRLCQFDGWTQTS